MWMGSGPTNGDIRMMDIPSMGASMGQGKFY
jgi:hypothetical protein